MRPRFDQVLTEQFPSEGRPRAPAQAGVGRLLPWSTARPTPLPPRRERIYRVSMVTGEDGDQCQACRGRRPLRAAS